jgi:hypothetical protein
LHAGHRGISRLLAEQRRLHLFAEDRGEFRAFAQMPISFMSGTPVASDQA